MSNVSESEARVRAWIARAAECGAGDSDAVVSLSGAITHGDIRAVLEAIDRLRSFSENLRLDVMWQSLVLERDKAVNDFRSARDDARILAHAYLHDTRPPADVVARSLSRGS